MKRLVAAAKFLVAATKILFVVPNFVAVTKQFFSMRYFKGSQLRKLPHFQRAATTKLIVKSNLLDVCTQRAEVWKPPYPKRADDSRLQLLRN